MQRDRVWSLWILGVAAFYFLAQATQRTILGGALEVDESEMLVLAQGWHLGYGPQLPLYNWLQVAAFDLIGANAAALAFLKDGVLWVAFAGMWCAMRAAFKDLRAAAAATLSLALLPNIIWEFQRASTHSIALLAAVTWTLWAVFRILQNGNRSDWFMLGVIMGLGGLSKANYWFVPATLLLAVAWGGPGMPRPSWRHLWIAVVTSGVIVALPYGWAVAHPDRTLASVSKFYSPSAAQEPWFESLVELATAFAGGLIFPAMVWAAFWAAAVRGRMGELPQSTRVLSRAGIICISIAAVLVVVFRVDQVASRWLVPVLIMLTAGAFGWLGSALWVRSFRWVVATAGICALITLVGMGQLRHGPDRTASVQFAPLLGLTDTLQPDLVQGDFFLTGNLRMHEPHLPVAVPGSPIATKLNPSRVLLLARGGSPPPPVPKGMIVLKQGELELPYGTGSAKIYPVAWYLVGPQLQTGSKTDMDPRNGSAAASQQGNGA